MDREYVVRALLTQQRLRFGNVRTLAIVVAELAWQAHTILDMCQTWDTMDTLWLPFLTIPRERQKIPAAPAEGDGGIVLGDGSLRRTLTGPRRRRGCEDAFFRVRVAAAGGSRNF